MQLLGFRPVITTKKADGKTQKGFYHLRVSFAPNLSCVYLTLPLWQVLSEVGRHSQDTLMKQVRLVVVVMLLMVLVLVPLLTVVLLLLLLLLLMVLLVLLVLLVLVLGVGLGMRLGTMPMVLLVASLMVVLQFNIPFQFQNVEVGANLSYGCGGLWGA